MTAGITDRCKTKKNVLTSNLINPTNDQISAESAGDAGVQEYWGLWQLGVACKLSFWDQEVA